MTTPTTSEPVDLHDGWLLAPMADFHGSLALPYSPVMVKKSDKWRV